MTKQITQGEIIQVTDNEGNTFEGEVRIPNLDNKNFGEMKTLVTKIAPEVLQERGLATFLTTTVDNADMVAINEKVIPLYQALRSISVQKGIDRDARATEEIYKFLNDIRTNLETLYQNKED